MGKPSAPKPPDPKETAQASIGTNVGTAIANTMMGNVDQYGPTGSLEYSQSGSHSWADPYTGQVYDIPTFSAQTTLSPQQQAIFDQQQGAELGMASTANIAGRNLQGILGKNFSPSDLPALGKVPGRSNFQNYSGDANLIDRNAQGGDITRSYGADDFSDDRQRVEQAIMGRMQPQIDQDRQRMESQLANQGIGMGARAYSAAQDDFSRGVNDARLGAILAGGQEQSRMVGMDRDRSAFQNAAQMQAFGQDATNIGMRNDVRQQGLNNQFRATEGNNQNLSQIFRQGMDQFNAQNAQRQQSMLEQFATRNQPINEITALLSGSQVAMPNFQMNQPSGIPTTDTAGLINQNYNQKAGLYQQQMGQWNSTMGGLFGMGAALISDERAKEGKRRVGKTDEGLPIYTYRYKGDDTTQMGVMAQDVQKKNPKAVKRMGDLMAVDYRGVR